MLILPFSCVPNDDDAIRLERAPWVNLGLIGLICLSFALVLWEAMELSIRHIVFGSFQFLYGSLIHLDFEHFAGNLILLAAFGNFANRWMGSWLYLGFIVAAGIGGTLAHSFFSDVPVFGASAIVFAALGYGLVIAPTMPVRCTYWILVKWGIVSLPLALVAGVLVLGQFVVFVLGRKSMFLLQRMGSESPGVSRSRSLSVSLENC